MCVYYLVSSAGFTKEFKGFSARHVGTHLIHS